jgi:hypothetical protein
MAGSCSDGREETVNTCNPHLRKSNVDLQGWALVCAKRQVKEFAANGGAKALSR